jgi:deoxyribodipyrimidine photo-lyase
VSTALVLFTRDLRVRDHPALAAATGTAERVVPLFVLDDALLGSDFAAPNRLRFLLESLADLDHALRARGAALVLRRGDVVHEAIAAARAAGADAIHLSADVSAYARARLRRLERACAAERVQVRAHPGLTVVPPGGLLPAGGDHFRVFTPYWRRWRAEPLRGAHAAPRRIELPAGIGPGRLPRLADLTGAGASPDLPRGGETAARRRLDAWLRAGLDRYGERHDDLAADATSRLSPYLRFGCLSPRELVERVTGRAGGEPFVRQLCWRDFHQQVTAANPDMPRADYRPRGHRWRTDADALAAWQEGRTGFPLVDAGMRQLAREGWMHNRARLVTASFLTRDLRIDWRAGARHFWDLLVDGEIANNAGNWQWVAGTGNDTRPNRVLNPVRQARRFDPDGEYVRRHVPELAGVEGPAVHEPWKLPQAQRRRLDYPDPVIDRGRGGQPALF